MPLSLRRAVSIWMSYVPGWFVHFDWYSGYLTLQNTHNSRNEPSPPLTGRPLRKWSPASRRLDSRNSSRLNRRYQKRKQTPNCTVHRIAWRLTSERGTLTFLDLIAIYLYTQCMCDCQKPHDRFCHRIFLLKCFLSDLVFNSVFFPIHIWISLCLSNMIYARANGLYKQFIVHGYIQIKVRANCHSQPTWDFHPYDTNNDFLSFIIANLLFVTSLSRRMTSHFFFISR